jgi:hypothetical protein
MLVAAVVLAAVSFQAPAASQKWVALVHTSGDVPSSWLKPLQEAAQERSGNTWVAPPAVTLDEAQLALGCAAWNKACAGQIAGMTGAAMALVVDVTGKDAGITIGVQAVKANGSAVGAEEKLELPGKTDKDLEFARDFVKKGQRSAYLVVETDVPGVEVSIDGEHKGKTSASARLQEMLPPGEHKLMLSMEGKAPLQKTVTLKPGVVTTEALSLSAAGPPIETTAVAPPPTPTHEVTTTPEQPPTPAPSGAGSGNAAVGFGLAGVGGAVVVVAGVLAGGAIYDRFFHRVPCGPKPDACIPNAPLVFGFYGKGPKRADFQNEAGTWIGGGIAAVGVGALLVGTGLVLATSAE